MRREKSSTLLACRSCNSAGAAFWDGNSSGERFLESLSSEFRRGPGRDSHGLPEVFCRNCNVRVLLTLK